MLAAGSARPPRRDITSLPTPHEGTPLSDVLAQMRNDERD